MFEQNSYEQVPQSYRDSADPSLHQLNKILLERLTTSKRNPFIHTHVIKIFAPLIIKTSCLYFYFVSNCIVARLFLFRRQLKNLFLMNLLYIYTLINLLNYLLFPLRQYPRIAPQLKQYFFPLFWLRTLLKIYTNSLNV